MTTATVPARFNGPLASGNGGYSCGLLAAHLENPAAVSLRRPIPLDRELEIRHEVGGSVAAFADGELVADAAPAPPLADWDAQTVGLEEARIAHENYVAPTGGEFSRCYVCGRARDDGFHLFAGPVSGTDLVASPWTPPAWAADGDGAVRPEHVWAALDCPGYFALHGAEGVVSYLARQQVEILTAPRAGEEYVVVGRPLERSGRKGLSATAILSTEGEVLAHGECLLIVPRPDRPDVT